MARLVRLRVRSHGAYQVEFKIDYRLSSVAETRYIVNTYIFVPHSLGINRRTYFNRDFHRDIQNYVRLKTPRLPLDVLATDPASPLVNSERILGIEGWHENERHQDHLVNNFKLMRPVLNASLRAHLRRVQRQQQQSGTSNASSDVVRLAVEAMINHGRTILERFRMMESRLGASDETSRVVFAFHLADEAVSIVYEEALTWAYQIAERYLEEAGDCLGRVRDEISLEVEYRKARGCKSILREDSENEKYLQITSALKKYTTSILYLSTSSRREGTTLEQISFAAAAGLSMVFATIIAFYSQALYGTLTFPVFVALVVGYMFKDRIKEMGRDLFARYVRNLLYDRRTTLHTLDGAHELGHVREKMTFTNRSNLSQAVLSQRKGRGETIMNYEAPDEEIICYAKEVTIERNAFGHIDIEELKIAGIRDIMRYDVRRYLRKMANPFQRRRMLVGEEMVEVNCRKTYQLDFVTEYRSRNEEKSFHYQHTIVHLDQDGIIGVQHVS